MRCANSRGHGPEPYGTFGWAVAASWRPSPSPAAGATYVLALANLAPSASLGTSAQNGGGLIPLRPRSESGEPDGKRSGRARSIVVVLGTTPNVDGRRYARFGHSTP